MKLAEIKGEKALDVLADLMDPVSEIVQDKEVIEQVRGNQRLKAVKTLLKGHKKSVIEIMAYLNEEDPETYQPSILKLPAMILEILNDPDFIELFSSGESEATSSGSPMEITEVARK